MLEAINCYPNAINYIKKFAFNHYLLKDFDDLIFSPFKIPCIFGFAYIRTLQI